MTELFATHRKAAVDYLEYRREIEGIAAEYRRPARHADDLALLDRIVERMREAHPAGDMAAEAAIDVEFHQAIGECAHNIILMHTLRSCYRLLSDGVFQNRILVFDLPGASAIRCSNSILRSTGRCAMAIRRRRAGRRWITSPMSNTRWPRPNAPATGSAWRGCA